MNPADNLHPWTSVVLTDLYKLNMHPKCIRIWKTSCTDCRDWKNSTDSSLSPYQMLKFKHVSTANLQMGILRSFSVIKAEKKILILSLKKYQNSTSIFFIYLSQVQVENLELSWAHFSRCGKDDPDPHGAIWLLTAEPEMVKVGYKNGWIEEYRQLQQNRTTGVMRYEFSVLKTIRNSTIKYFLKRR